MGKSKNVKIVVFVPEPYAEKVRNAIGGAGGGHVGNYTFCSFSSKGIGRFKPGVGAHPNIGEVGKLESVVEERIEMVCERSNLMRVIQAIEEVHPYEEVAVDIYPLEELPGGA